MFILILMVLSVVTPLLMLVVVEVIEHFESVKEMESGDDFYRVKFEKKFGIKAK